MSGRAALETGARTVRDEERAGATAMDQALNDSAEHKAEPARGHGRTNRGRQGGRSPPPPFLRVGGQGMCFARSPPETAATRQGKYWPAAPKGYQEHRPPAPGGGSGLLPTQTEVGSPLPREDVRNGASPEGLGRTQDRASPGED
ncbi:unnamed protein product, partial [Ixodes persulcatus]